MEGHQAAGQHGSYLEAVPSISSIPVSLARMQFDGWSQLQGSEQEWMEGWEDDVPDGNHIFKAALHSGRGEAQLLMDG